MSDRLYTRIQRDGKTVYPVFNFDAMMIRVEEQDPHPEGGLALTAPFYVDPQTFYGVSGRLMELHRLKELTEKRLEGNMHVIPSLEQAATRQLKIEQRAINKVVDLSYSEGDI